MADVRLLRRAEPLLLFLVFFLPAFLFQGREVSGDLFDSLAFNLFYLLQAGPQVLLLLYLIVLRTDAEGTSLAAFGIARPTPWTVVWSLALALAIFGLLAPLTEAGTLFSSGPLADRVRWRLTNPALVPVVLLTCVLTGYHEELFFRSYLLTVLPGLGFSDVAAVLATTLLFASGHVYQGLPGFIGTAVIGACLSIVFLRKRSLHLVALAHGLYDFLALLSTLLLPPQVG